MIYFFQEGKIYHVGGVVTPRPDQQVDPESEAYFNKLRGKDSKVNSYFEASLTKFNVNETI